MNNIEDYKADLYSNLEIRGTGYLAFRDTPELIKKYANGKITLDYGCGAGRSTRFLKQLGLIVKGVDISRTMLDKAQQRDRFTSYTRIINNHIPNISNFYDIVFSSLVFFEISSLSEIEMIFKEIYRVLKHKGIFIIITGSTEMYKHQWLSLDVNFIENQYLTSGSRAKVRLKEINLELHDYFWTDKNYKSIISASGLSLLEQINPLGCNNDNFDWISETSFSPYVIYVLQKLT